MSESKSAISIALGRPPYQKEFHNIEELQKWFADERNKFEWIQKVTFADVTHDRNYLEKLWGKINGWHAAISKLIADWKSHAHDEKELEKTIQAHKNSLLGELKAEEILLSSSSEMEFIFGLRRRRSDLVAAYALCFLMDLDVPSTNDATEGMFWVLRYREGSTATVESQAHALEALAAKWNASFQEQRSKNQEAADNQNNSLATLIGEVKSLKREASVLLNQQSTDYESHKNQLEVDLKSIKTAFSSELGLKEPVNYWQAKLRYHRWVLCCMAVVTLFVAGAAIYCFICAAYQFSHADIGRIPLLHLSILFAISTAGIWLTRICSKIFISNLHLRTDAHERVTMCKTYLALLAIDKGITETDRQLMLQTLFRPSSTGFIKEDGPSGVFELAKIWERRGG
ncbi:hypothetical protein SAMN05216403_10354 [Nitrosospira multiformis ATCC 25196]|uniref:DUF6161 domain-containing protein n=1 Tax=Nitrosospira multiformis (strain ATCC 25196 / NCIMB 11849 / C 71) TaxID=323848 RepID=Q2YB81_NITMU|nr:DUF6161 domain-containing protein [Nitrosospira multiformis]ABB73990.1 hypothetical protein Nmul_A0683 [Nitrosospira multiformis ATCC 25196]SEF53939.1 hypothetical protein SAMN05216403_10354 [Nitrosospira multiformis ATCC 25196]